MMKFLKLPTLLAFVFSGAGLMAQSLNSPGTFHPGKGSGYQSPNTFVPATHRSCATVEKVAQSLKEHPELVAEHDAVNRYAEQYAANPAMQKTHGIITIPVVVHVVYDNANANISDAQIASQITILNQDYRRQNADASQTPAAFLPVAADCGIEFCLATQDPNGVATTGITRTSTTTNNIGSTNSYYTTAPAWDRSRYLNIWVCEIGGGTLGFAYLPGTAPASYDGVVIDYHYFGNIGTATYPFNKGRTATHEVGHWLNLRHIWADDNGGCSQDDLVADTPIQGDENYGCPSNPSSCSNGGDMSMNYMDYTDDRCMNIFTQGQSARMNSTLSGTRSSLVSSNGCGGGGGPGPVSCADTLNYPLGGTPTLYLSSGGWGYVSGHNNYGDISKADYFPNTGGYVNCSGMRLEFAIASSSGPTASIQVKIWDDNGGTPGAQLGSATLLIDDIINNAGVVDVAFSSPVALSGAFYAGISFDYTNALDTVALISTADGDISPGISWEEFGGGGGWYPMTDGTNSWGVNLGQAIYPFVSGAPLNVSVSPINPAILAGNSVTLTASGASTYSWSPATGLSSTSGASVTASPAVTTTYTVTGTDGACSGTETVTVTVTPQTGIANGLFNEGSIAIFPNPGNGLYTLQFTLAGHKNLDVIVTNALGQKVYTRNLGDVSGSFDGVLDLSNQPKGIYLLRITDGQRQFVQKLVIE